MNDLLPASRRHKRLNNLKRIRRILTLTPLVVLCMLLIDWGISFSHASNAQVQDTSAILSLLYKDDVSNLREGLTPKIVQIKTIEGSKNYLVYSDSVEGVLKEAGVELSYYDIVLPQDLDVVVSGSTLQIVKVDVDIITKTESVPFSTVQVESNQIAYGQVEVSQEGVLGVMEKTIRVIYEDGKATRSEVVGQKIIRNPVEKVLSIGMKAVGIQDCAHWDSVIDEYAPPSKDATKNRWMKYIMRAETWCNSGRITKNMYFGLFQFRKSTFTGNGGNVEKIFDGREQIRIVSKMYNLCQHKQWTPHDKTNAAGTIISFKDKHPDHYKAIQQKCGG